MWAVVASSVATASSYYLSRSVLTVRQSLAAATLASADYWLWEGFLMAPLVLHGWALIAVALRPVVEWSVGVQCRWRIGLMAGSLALLPFVNQTFAALCVLVFAVGLPAALAVRYGDFRLSRSWWLLGGCTAGGSVALLALPYYLPVAPGSEVVTYGQEVTLKLLSDRFLIVQVTAIISIIAAWVFWGPVRRTGGAFWVLFAGMLLCTLLLPWESTDEALWNITFRANYLTALFAIPLLVLAASRLRLGWKALGLAVFGLSLYVLFFSSIFKASAELIPLTGATLEGYEWISETTAPDDVIILRSWGGSKVAAVFTDRPTLESMHFGTLDSEPPNYIQRTAYAVRCVMLASPEYCIYGSVADEIERFNMRMVFADVYDTGGIHEQEDMAWRRVHAQPYTELVWEGGAVRIWELHPELAPD